MKVLTNTAITLDGKIASYRFDHVAIGTAVDRRYMSVLRARADAVLVGGRTFRNWPLPLVPDAAAIEALRADGFPDTEVPPLADRSWWNVVVTRTLDVPRQGRFYADPRVRRLFLSQSPGEVAGAEVVVGPTTVPWILDQLRGRGVETLLVEAGGALIFELLAADAVDELHVTLCPRLLGGAGAPTLVDGRGFGADELRELRLRSCYRWGEELYLRYEVERGR